MFLKDKLHEGQMMNFVLERVKTLWEKEKMLVTSIFSFSLNISKAPSIRVMKTYDHVVKASLYTKRQFLKLVQIESNFADDKNKCNFKTEFLSGMGRKYCRKRRTCWLPAFCTFPTIFSNDFFFGVVKSQGYVVKGLWK